MRQLLLTCPDPPEEALSFLFQRGILVPVTPGTGMAEFLLCSLEIPDEYFQERIQTIFLNGKPVDDPARAVVGPGSAVALSASLPGLAGATMRKGGKYACFRSSISHRESAGGAETGAGGFATLKLFNLLIGELGLLLLSRGVVVPASTLLDLLQSVDLAGRCMWSEGEDVAVSQELLAGGLAALQEEPVEVRLAVANQGGIRGR